MELLIKIFYGIGAILLVLSIPIFLCELVRITHVENEEHAELLEKKKGEV